MRAFLLFSHPLLRARHVTRGLRTSSRKEREQVHGYECPRLIALRYNSSTARGDD